MTSYVKVSHEKAVFYENSISSLNHLSLFYYLHFFLKPNTLFSYQIYLFKQWLSCKLRNSLHIKYWLKHECWNFLSTLEQKAYSNPLTTFIATKIKLKVVSIIKTKSKKILAFSVKWFWNGLKKLMGAKKPPPPPRDIGLNHTWCKNLTLVAFLVLEIRGQEISLWRREWVFKFGYLPQKEWV